jgi:murein DD-endopeptidase MepM/ murein hydrolase activator NlpD
MQRALIATKGELVLQGVRLETLRLNAAAAQKSAERASARAAVAEDRARTQQQRLSSLAKKRSAALASARVHKTKIKSRLIELEQEQERLEQAAAKAAREEARRRAAAAAAGSTVAPTGDLRWPVDTGSISARVGPRTHPVFGYPSCHTGVDVAAPTGTPVFAAAAGTIATITSGGAYGNAVLIAHGDGLTTFYAHLSSVAVQVGRQVDKGQTVGGIGSTGWSTGPHLHFETRINGSAYDPLGWFGGSRTPVKC